MAKIIMRGPLLYASYVCVERYRESKIEDEFCGGFLRWQFTTLAKDSSHAWSLLGSNIG